MPSVVQCYEYLAFRDGHHSPIHGLPGLLGYDCEPDPHVHRMTQDLFSLMLSWLESGEPHQRRHAEYRLSLPDAVGFEMPIDYVPLAPVRFTLPVFLMIEPRGWKNCLYSSEFVAGCCHAPATVQCHWKGERTTYGQCDECVKAMA